MYSVEKIVQIVNECLMEIERDLHMRSAIDVFTKGNCGIMPKFYGKTGVSVIPYFARTPLPHILSVLDIDPIEIIMNMGNLNDFLQGKVFDIKCSEEKPLVNLKGLQLEGPPSDSHLERASYNFGVLPPGAREVRRLRAEKVRMSSTGAKLDKKLSRLGMLGMKKNPGSGLYLPNESVRQP